MKRASAELRENITLMHNSIWIRERLREMNQDPLHRLRRDPHRHVGPDANSRVKTGCFRLDGRWVVKGPERNPGMSEIGHDLSDYLKRMGVQISPAAIRQVVIEIDPSVPDQAVRLSSRPQRVSIASGTIAGLWAGVSYLEREMSMRRGPFLPETEAQITPAWEIQISQSPWGSNYLVPDLSPDYLSDDAFRLLAHYGVNGMTIYGDLLFYAKSEILPELNHRDRDTSIMVLRDATERAARYGISLYWVPVLPKLAEDHAVFRGHPGVRGARLSYRPGKRRLHTLCSSNPQALAFIAEVMESIFREVPLLGGLVLIVGGESFYHCYMRPDREGLGAGRTTNCQTCSRRPAEEVVAGFVRNTTDAVHRAKPGALVVAWPYSASGWSEDPEQLGLIRSLPEGAGLLSEIDKDQIYQKDGYRKHIWDYSVDFTGPSDRIVAQADACRERGLPFCIKTETALGLEAIHMPYVPCLNRLAEKWRNVHGLKPHGVLQSWMFFGMWGSRAEELGWWTRWRPEVPPHVVLERMAERDFGAASAPVLTGWEEMSRAVGHLPFIPPYFMGPWFLGPAHPLLRDGDPTPKEFTGALYYLQEAEESLSAARLDTYAPLVLTRLPESPGAWGFQCEDEDPWARVLEEMERAVDHAARGMRLIEDAQRVCDLAADATRLREEQLHFEYFHRTLISVLHALTYLRLDDGDDEILSVLEDELGNARGARHIYREAPWLDLSLRVDAGFTSSNEMLESKIRLLEERLN